MKNIILLLCSFFIINANAQNIGLGTTNPHPSAAIDITGNNKGILIPRTDTSSISSPADGLLMFQNSDNQFYYYANSIWNGMGGNAAFEKVGNTVKQSSVGTDDDFIFGRNSLPTNGDPTWNSYFFFDQSRYAFRGGRNIGSHWDTDSLGYGSFAYGQSTKAIGNASTAIGKSSITIGYANVAIGENNETRGYYSAAIGSRNKIRVSGFAFGINNLGTSANSMAFGYSNTNRGVASVAIGRNIETTSLNEVALGQSPTIYTDVDSTGYYINNRVFVIGNGNGSQRRDAFSIFQNGKGIYNGSFDIVGNNQYDSIGLYQNHSLFNNKGNFYGSIINVDQNSGFSDDIIGQQINVARNGIGKRFGLKTSLELFPTSTDPGYGIHSEVTSNATSQTAYAGYFSATGVGNFYSGYFLGKAFFNDKVGIGTESPDSPLNIVSDNYRTGINMDLEATNTSSYGIFLDITQEFNRNVFGSYFRGRLDGDSGTSYGVYAAGSSYIPVGVNGNVYGLYATAYKQSSGGSSYGVFANASGQATTEWGVYCNGDMRVTGTYNPSDLKLKKDIEITKNAEDLEQLLQLKVKKYNYKVKEFESINLPKGERTGFIAQEIQKLFPQYVKQTFHSTFDPEKHDHDLAHTFKEIEYLTVDYTALIPHMVSAIQGQQSLIKNQKVNLKQLKEDQLKQEIKIKDLENKLNQILQANK